LNFLVHVQQIAVGIFCTLKQKYEEKRENNSFLGQHFLKTTYDNHKLYGTNCAIIYDLI
jgi:hypothetical protein